MRQICVEPVFIKPWLRKNLFNNETIDFIWNGLI